MTGISHYAWLSFGYLYHLVIFTPGLLAGTSTPPCLALVLLGPTMTEEGGEPPSWR
jgi:hypothetical protein